MSLPTARMLPHTVTVRRKTWTHPSGVRTASEATESLRGHIQPMTAQQATAYGIDLSRNPAMAYFTADPDVSPRDEIAWGSRTFSVLGSSVNQAGRGVVWAVALVEMKGG